MLLDIHVCNTTSIITKLLIKYLITTLVINTSNNCTSIHAYCLCMYLAYTYLACVLMIKKNHFSNS
jgi:hypothetical protein